jgi:hypothetical protein
LARWQVAVILGVSAYVFVALAVLDLAYRHACLGAILIGLALSGRSGFKRFLRDWFPLLLFWIGYDAMRDFAALIAPRVAVVQPYAVEKSLFGWMAGGQVPAIYLLHLITTCRWGPLVEVAAEVVYWSHFVVIPVYLLCLWWTPPTPPLFRRFVYGITLLHAVTLATYFLYPAAPPWYVYYFGFQPPPQALLTSSAFLHAPLRFKSLWAANPNYFAAIPSLHGAYPVFLLCMLGIHHRRRGLVIGYGLTLWLSTIVLGNHYIIDLILGAFYAWVCAWVGNYFGQETTAQTYAPVAFPMQTPSSISLAPALLELRPSDYRDPTEARSAGTPALPRESHGRRSAASSSTSVSTH